MALARFFSGSLPLFILLSVFASISCHFFTLVVCYAPTRDQHQQLMHAAQLIQSTATAAGSSTAMTGDQKMEIEKILISMREEIKLQILQEQKELLDEERNAVVLKAVSNALNDAELPRMNRSHQIAEQAFSLIQKSVEYTLLGLASPNPSFAYGRRPDSPALSCFDILKSNDNLPDDPSSSDASSASSAASQNKMRSGIYWIDPSGTGNFPYAVYCDMETNGGGWTLVARLGANARVSTDFER